MSDPDAAPREPTRRRRRRGARASASAARRVPEQLIDAPDAPGTEEEPGRGPLARAAGWWGALTKPIQALAALAAAIATIVGVVTLLWPDPKPTGSVAIEEPLIDFPVTRAQSLVRLSLPPTGFTEEQLAERGAFATVSFRVVGFAGEQLPVRWSVLDSEGNTVGLEDRRTRFEPERDDMTIVHRFWAAIPEARGPHRLEVEVYGPGADPGDPAVAPLDLAQSAPFPAVG